MAIDKLLVGLGASLGGLVYKGFNHYTKYATETQDKLLRDLMRKNAKTEYGRKYGFADIHSAADYQAKVPYSDYSDYAGYIDRMLKGEKDLITHYNIRRYVETSGSAGKPKVVPISKKSLWNLQCMGFVGPEYCVKKYYAERGQKMTLTKGMLSWIVMQHKMPNGEACCDLASIPLCFTGPIVSLYSTSPKELIFAPEPEKMNTPYLILRFGLPDKDVSYIGAVIITLSVTMFQYLEKNWQMLCDDIEKGVINDSIEIPDYLRKKLSRKIKADPARAAELRAEFEKGFDTPIVPRIWPRLCWVYGMMASTLSVYADKIKRYTGDIPIHNMGYGASEGYMAMPLTLDAPDAVILPRSEFFEFLPVDAPEGTRPLLLGEVEPGNDYEVVLTNLSGFYRYRLGDVVHVTGFYQNSPKVRFMYRANLVINLTDEKTTQKMLEQAMAETAEQATISYDAYSVYGDPASQVPHYVVLVETPDDVKEELCDKLAELFDANLQACNIEYGRYRKSNTLSCVEAHFLRPGTNTEYRAMLQKKGQDTNQLKPVTIINSSEKKDFFFSHIMF